MGEDGFDERTHQGWHHAAKCGALELEERADEERMVFPRELGGADRSLLVERGEAQPGLLER